MENRQNCSGKALEHYTTVASLTPIRQQV